MANHKLNLLELPTLESMLTRIDAIKLGNKTFEMLVPDRMTFHGRLICRSFPESVVLDRLLQKGFAPIGGLKREDGYHFEFAKTKPIDAANIRTEPPPVEITAIVPELAPLTKATTRLHPRRAIVTDPAGSKLGGTFLWPRSEPWPRCDDQRHSTGNNGRKSATDGICPLLVGVVQLNAREYPHVPFPPGKDLLQLLWCPIIEDVHDDVYHFPKLFAYWRNSNEVKDPIDTHPLPDVMETIFNLYPISCRLFPEAVNELPTLADLSSLPNHKKVHAALAADDQIWNQYQGDLCASPGTKLGGYPYWIQNDDTPTCVCGNRMDFLLQLWDWEYTNMESTQRWIPLADRWAVKKWTKNAAADALLRPPYFDFGHNGYYIFICPRCPGRHVKLVSQ